MHSLLFIGGGNMARSLIGGVIAGGQQPAQITVCEPNEAARQALATDFGVTVANERDSARCAAAAEVIVLAVKPQVMAAVASSLSDSLSHQPLVISIAAGIDCAALGRWLGAQTAVVRAMPNTPALLCQGATGLFASPAVSEPQRAAAEQLFAAIGTAQWVAQEQLIDTVTALSGSGPAYFFLLIELMQKIAEEMGLPTDVARRLAVQTARGAASMAVESGDSAAELRAKVTSPAGTTERALAIFAEHNIEQIVREAMLGAAARSAEMAAELGAATPTQ